MEFDGNAQGTGDWGRGWAWQTINRYASRDNVNPVIPTNQPSYNGSLLWAFNKDGSVNQDAINSNLQHNPYYSLLSPAQQQQVQKMVAQDQTKRIQEGASPFNTQLNLPYDIRHEVDTADPNRTKNWQSPAPGSDPFWGENRAFQASFQKYFPNLYADPNFVKNSTNPTPGYIRGNYPKNIIDDVIWNSIPTGKSVPITALGSTLDIGDHPVPSWHPEPDAVSQDKEYGSPLLHNDPYTMDTNLRSAFDQSRRVSSATKPDEEGEWPDSPAEPRNSAGETLAINQEQSAYEEGIASEEEYGLTGVLNATPAATSEEQVRGNAVTQAMSDL
ncbi:hypothetical protein [Burkholderia sp. TSV86]|uniref:hypothetical protein n=1 Tax=Burkholderia sp. TSV86 TaxID=1385594 RepID=UPI000B2D4F6A|nr:hypothetical protein [Burkholderia sp. TSV86]